MENFIILTVHVYHLLQGFMHLELSIEPGGARGENTSMGGELTIVNFEDDIAKPSLLSLQPKHTDI